MICEHLERGRSVGVGGSFLSGHLAPRGWMCNIWQQLYTLSWNVARSSMRALKFRRGCGCVKFTK
jgi:hypothetical protein